MHELITGTERKLKQIDANHVGKGKHRPELNAQAEKLEVVSRRIKHLRVAAENLKMADEHDLAQKLMEQSEAMDRDVQRARQELAAEKHQAKEHHGEYGPDVVRDLKAEIERLRAEIKELNSKVEKR